MPKCSALEVTFANNIVYNWTGRGSASNNAAVCDFINNYHKEGPAARDSYNRMPFVFSDGCSGAGPDDSCVYSFYVDGNLNQKNDFGVSFGNPWEGASRETACRDRIDDGWCLSNGAAVPEKVRRTSALPTAPMLTLQRMTSSLRDEILNVAGHSRRLQCDGSWTPVREAIDQERIDWFYAGRGPASTVDVSGMVIPAPARGTPCSDSDGDGIPDEYEIRYSGSSTGLRADSRTPSGYLVVELYLAGLPPDWLP
jgi:hypothetical protein